LFYPDTDLQVQALSTLIHTDAAKVVPMLKKIALEADNPDARRAVFALAQSRIPLARATVIDMAKRGPEPVQIAAVRDLGLFGGPDVTDDLLQVYSTAKAPVKQQVVMAFGDRADVKALLHIVESEGNRVIRQNAIIMLGRAGGSKQLRSMFVNAPVEIRRAIIDGLFTARDDEGLIRIAEQESDVKLRQEVMTRLRILGTPKAKTYLERAK
jgi:HEAT repeat protein